MESSIFRQIAELAREHKTAARATAVFLCLALVVSAVTMGVLTSTGHAMTQKVKVLTCPLTLHEHTPECRDAEGNLICGYADYVVHVHNDDCYGEDGALVCTLREVYPHTHQDSCYEEVKTVVCGQEAAQPHVHTEACYDRQRGELTCTQAEHTHGADCYLREEVLTCDKTEQEHVHNDSCYTVSRELSCGQEESEEHTHTDECYTETRTLTCDKTTEPHVHGPECYTVNETLTCTVPEHTHTDECYNWTETLICDIPEGQIPEGGHVHTDACYEISRELVCGQLEKHEHTEDCFEHDAAGNRVGDPICGQIELLEHVHGEDCFTIEEREIESAGNGPFFFETTGEDPEVPAKEYACGLEEHSHDDSCRNEAGEIVCGLEEHTHDETCLAPAPAAEESAAAEESSQFTCGRSEHIHGDACKDENGEIICGLEEHIHDASCLEAPEGGGAKVYRDGRVLITAVYPAEADLPEDVTLRAEQLTREKNLSDYESYLEQMQSVAGEADLSTVVLYNIGFYTPDGVEVEPEATVNVSIQFLDESGLITGAPLTVVHFAEDGTKVLESVTEGSSVSFDTDSFSPFSIFLDTPFAVMQNNDGIATIAAGNDLGDYIKGMKLQKKDGNEWVDLKDGEDIVLGNNYKLTVHFEGGIGGFQNPMKWNLGNSVKCAPVENGPLWDGSKQIGTYTLTEDGQLTVEFTEEFLSGNNQKLDMFFEMVPTQKPGSDDDAFPWSGKIEDHNTVDNAGELEVKKAAGWYSNSGGTIEYTVEASVTKGMIKDGKLTDTMEDGLTFDSIDDIRIYDADRNDVTSRYQDAINSLKEQAASQKGQSPWTLKDLPDLTQGMTVEVKYKGLVDAGKRSDRDYVAKNTVTFGGTQPDGKTPAEEKKATAEKPLAKDQIQKTGDTIVVGEGDNAKEVIQWTVRVGSGQWDPLENNADLTIVDTLGQGLSFRKDEKFKVAWCDKDGNVGQEVEIDWEDIVVSTDGKEATYHLKKDLFTNYAWEDGDYLQVTYNTDYDPTKQPEDGFANTVKNNVLAPDGTTGRLPVGEAVQKTVVDDEKNECLLYTVVVDVPPASHMKSMKNEGDGHDELDLPYFYIQDQLEFDSKDTYFVYNTPQDVEISARGKYSGTVWNFENVPHTSTAAEGTETFEILPGPESTRGDDGKNKRDFRIYFNTARYGLGSEGKLERHDSIWDIYEATVLTITYKIPYNSIVVGLDGKDTGKTVGDLLPEGYKLINNAYSKRSGVELSDSVYTEKTPDAESIDKVARVLSGGEVEYRVSFINHRESDNSRLIKLYKEGEEKGTRDFDTLDPTLIDVFDKRMEYVPDSLYVEVRSKSDNSLKASYKYSGSNPVGVNADGSPTLTAKMADFNERIDGNTSYNYDNLRATFGDGEQRKYVFVYRLKLKDEYQLKDWNGVDGIENEATFQFGDKTPKDKTVVDIPSDMLQKTLTTTESGTLLYTLHVNILGLDLVTIPKDDGTTVNLDSYKLVDHMSDNLELLTKDGEYIITVTDGAGMPLTRSPSSDGINRESHNYYQAFDENGDLYFILPDELAVNITYEVKVNGAENSQTFATNTATLYADHTESDERNTLYDVGTSGGSGSSDPTIRLQKKDAEADKLLPGAEFVLYGDVPVAYEGSEESITVNGSTKLNPVAKYTTGMLGEIKNIGPSSENRNGLYALVETKAPDGYILSAEPYFFRFPGAEGTTAGEYVTYNGKDYPVNLPNANFTVVFDNPPEAYTLPESGGEGFGPLYAVGIAMMALSAVLLLETSQRKRKGGAA